MAGGLSGHGAPPVPSYSAPRPALASQLIQLSQIKPLKQSAILVFVCGALFVWVSHNAEACLQCPLLGRAQRCWLAPSRHYVVADETCRLMEAAPLGGRRRRPSGEESAAVAATREKNRQAQRRFR